MKITTWNVNSINARIDHFIKFIKKDQSDIILLQELKCLNEKFPYQEILESVHKLSSQKVLVIGDGIVDEYHYCEPMGKSSKSNLIVNRYLDNEVFAGGAFAIANHVSGLCKHVQLVTLLGKENSREGFISENLKPNVKTNLENHNSYQIAKLHPVVSDY